MIAPRSSFRRFSAVRHGERRFNVPVSRNAVESKGKDSTKSWFERDGLLWWEYSAAPRVSSVADNVVGGRREIECLRSQQSVSELVAQFTKELFEGAVIVRQESDPDFQSDYFVVSVAACGDVDQLIALNDQWHRRIRDVVGEAADQFRLSIDVQ